MTGLQADSEVDWTDPDRENPFKKFQLLPIEFGEEILHEHFTPDVCALMQSIRDNPVTIARSANSTGKTHAAARVALWFYLVFSDAQVYTCAAPPLDNLQRLLWGEIGSVLEKYPDLFKGHKITTLNVARSAKSFLTGVTIPSQGTAEEREARFSGKHAPHMLFIVDEGDAVPDEVYKGIESCMSGGYARLLIMFNPRRQAGPVYVKERDRQARIVHLSAFNHPNVTTGENKIPGAVDRETTVRRINEWTRPLSESELPNDDTFEVPEFLVGVVARSLSGDPYPPLPAGSRKVTNPAFFYMVLGRYPTQAIDQLISGEWISNARARYDLYVSQYGITPPTGLLGIQGQDVAEYGPDDSVACLRYGWFVPPLESWNGMDPLETGRRAARIARKMGALHINVDANGVGAGVVPVVKEELGKSAFVHRIMVQQRPTEQPEFGEFDLMRDQCYWACREWLRTDPNAMLPPDERLMEELRVPTYEFKSGRIHVMDKRTMKELMKRSPDRLESLILTFAPTRDGDEVPALNQFDYLKGDHPNERFTDHDIEYYNDLKTRVATGSRRGEVKRAPVIRPNDRSLLRRTRSRRQFHS